jgi:hypothetical protein
MTVHLVGVTVRELADALRYSGLYVVVESRGAEETTYVKAIPEFLLKTDKASEEK